MARRKIFLKPETLTRFAAELRECFAGKYPEQGFETADVVREVCELLDAHALAGGVMFDVPDSVGEL